MAILGIDEVGRGPFAGPLVVGAVILPDFSELAEAEKPKWYLELKDSKKLSAKKREKLAEEIAAGAKATGLGFVTASEIDKLGMTEALKLAARRAVKNIQKTKVSFNEVIIDGNLNFFENTRLEKYTTTLIRGDDLIKEISAASIIAKVARDKYMEEIASEYPEYDFEKHVGYGTKFHRDQIEKYGLCPEHRRLIKCLRPVAEKNGEDLSEVFLEETRKNTTSIGMKAEGAVAEYLERAGHEIISRNFKTKFFEIDIISVDEKKIYFTEVKYRKNNDFGGGLAAIDKKKLGQMRFAAECFLKFRKRNFEGYDPVLAVAKVGGKDYRVQDWFVI